MKKLFGRKKRFISLLMAFVMLASIMPLELIAGAFDTAASANEADVSVVMSVGADGETEKTLDLSDTAQVTLSVTLKENVQSATVKIQLTQDELSMMEPFWDTSSAATLSEGGDTEMEFDKESKILTIHAVNTNESGPCTWETKFSVFVPKDDGSGDDTAINPLTEEESTPAPEETQEYVFSITGSEVGSEETPDITVSKDDIELKKSDAENESSGQNGTGDSSQSIQTPDEPQSSGTDSEITVPGSETEETGTDGNIAQDSGKKDDDGTGNVTDGEPNTDKTF